MSRSFILSWKKNWRGIIMMFFSSVCVATGQLLWKISGAVINLQLILGFVCYETGALIMILAYRYGSLSVLHPLLSIGYILSAIFGYVYLQEMMSLQKLIGIVFISLGVIFISGGDDV